MKDIRYISSPAQLHDALDYLKDQRVLGFDTETNGLDPLVNDVLLLQLGNKRRQYVFDVGKLGDSISDVLTILVDDTIEKIAHYAKFDYSMVLGNFGISTRNIVCTLMGTSLLTKGILSASGKLDDCLDKYLGIKMDKEEQKSFIGMKPGDDFTEGQIEYAGLDVMYMEDLKESELKLLKERGMEELFVLECETTRVCGDLEVNGIYLDTKMWMDLAKKAKEEAKKAREVLDEHFKEVCQWDIFGKPVVNYNSPVQLLPLLEEITGETLESTGEEDLSKIDHPAVKALLDYRGWAKKHTTYGDEFVKKHVHRKTGRVHSDFRQLGTDSGRMASRNPNLQNIPAGKEYRDCFRAQSEDYKIISADFSGQELRLLAYISGEEEFKYALDNKMDLHSYSASLIFGLDYNSFLYHGTDGINEAVDDYGGKFKHSDLTIGEEGVVLDGALEPLIRPSMKKKYRTPAKSITFGLIYGMGPGKLARDLGIEIYEAFDLIDKYFAIFPKVKEKLDEFTDIAMNKKYAYSPLDGRRRIFSGVDWDHPGKVAHMKNIAKNQPFQGAGASVTKLAMCKIKHRIDGEKWDARLINVVHDEILIEVHKDIAETVAKALEEEMIKAFNYYAPTIPMNADAEIDDMWVH